jgi:bifunctional DNase/RNase
MQRFGRRLTPHDAAARPSSRHARRPSIGDLPAARGVSRGEPAVIEMSVRAVKRAGADRLVAVLEREASAGDPAGRDPTGRLLVTISRPEAHVLYHELRAERTLPGQTYELMAQVVTQLHGKLTAVELVADEGGKPAARLRLERTDGRSVVPTRAGQALALAVHLKVPLLVAEALLAADKRRPATSPDDTGRTEAQPAPAVSLESAAVSEADVAPDGPSPVEVPEAFLRAFDE